ncbi:hypothetical protein GCM10022237_32540 [Nocardioides ginsengisoli]|uniref:DUF2752 domain-containing protein n=1 Tax=Nocardioides ginsengisoli TaxID=363868 RepID=A0ABW3W7B8_9ACTN
MSTTHAPATRWPASSELVAAAGVVALGVSALLAPAHIEDGPVICPFRRITGLPCPGCGLTRSWTYLTHGWWHHAVSANAFGPVLALVVLGLAVAVVRARLRRQPAPSLDRLVKHPAARIVLIAWLGFAVVRAALVAFG